MDVGVSSLSRTPQIHAEKFLAVISSELDELFGLHHMKKKHPISLLIPL
jgi:hypothetical protein